MEYIPARTIVNRNRPKSWFGYEYTMNIYRGCTHGCIYCDSRCSCYKVQNFDEIKVKADALRIIRDDLRRKTVKGVICSGAMSDPYNECEKELQLSRHALELINAYEFGVGLITKSPLISRDIDILQDIQTHSPVLAKLTITAADDRLSKMVEPDAPVSSERFQALRELRDADIFAGVVLMPVLPFIEDTEENITALVEQAAEAGARFIYPRMGVTLRGNQREWYYQQLEERFPGIKEKYTDIYGEKTYCNSRQTRKLMKILRARCDKYGILYDVEAIIKESRKENIFSWKKT